MNVQSIRKCMTLIGWLAMRLLASMPRRKQLNPWCNNRLIVIVLAAAIGLALRGQLSGQTFKVLHSFAGGSEGARPAAELILSSNTLYSTSTGSQGIAYVGPFAGATVFKVNTDGTQFSNMYTFTPTSANWPYPNSDGAFVNAGLILSSNTLYGTAGYGGIWGEGTVFKLNADGSGFTNLHTFTALDAAAVNSDGAHPKSALVLLSNTLYGTTQRGGSWRAGTVFKINTDGSGFATLHSFTRDTNGAAATGGLILSSNTLYGTTQGFYSGGASDGSATVFRINIDGTGFRTLYTFTGVASTSITNTDGANPTGRLALSGGALYGTTWSGGSWGMGTVFKVNIDGTGFTTLHTFTALDPQTDTNIDGAFAAVGLALSGNTLYGTTTQGGWLGRGTLFRMNIDGTGFTTLYSFTGGNDGANPAGGLILLSNTLYGTAQAGGGSGNGTVFSLSLPAASLPQITGEPLSRTNIAGTSASFSVVATGPAPLSYLWLKGTNAMPQQNGSTLTLTNVSDADAGSYSVIVSNAAGSVTSTAATLTVLDPPLITRQPLNRTNLAASIASFSVVATGTTPLSYQWLKGNSPLAQKTSSTLTLANVSDGDAASYSVIITNTAGKVTSVPATLTVIDPPLITSQPLSRTNLAGTTAPFSVVATGTAPLSYQWWKEASPIAQQRGSTLTLTNVSDADAGSYSVVVTNAAGKVTSTTATLTVIDRPRVIISGAGKNVVLSWATNLAGFTLQSSTNLGSTAVWATVSPSPIVLNGQNIVTNPLSGTQQFFRLTQ